MAGLRGADWLDLQELGNGEAEAGGDALEGIEGGVAVAGFDAVERHAVEFQHERELALGKSLFGTQLRDAHPELAPEFRVCFLHVCHGLSVNAGLLGDGRVETTV